MIRLKDAFEIGNTIGGYIVSRFIEEGGKQGHCDRGSRP